MNVEAAEYQRFDFADMLGDERQQERSFKPLEIH